MKVAKICVQIVFVKAIFPDHTVAAAGGYVSQLIDNVLCAQETFFGRSKASSPSELSPPKCEMTSRKKPLLCCNCNVRRLIEPTSYSSKKKTPSTSPTSFSDQGCTCAVHRSWRAYFGTE
jgi:hypothetical protein